MTTDRPIRERLAEYLREQATAREERAAEHPVAAGEVRAAEQLRQLADYVDRLSDDNPHVRALEAVHDDPGVGDAYVPGENARALLLGFPFHHDVTELEALFTELIAAEVGDEIDSLDQEAREP